MYDYRDYKDCSHCDLTYHVDNQDLVQIDTIKVDWNNTKVNEIYDNAILSRDSEYLCHDCAEHFINEVHKNMEEQRILPRMLDIESLL